MKNIYFLSLILFLTTFTGVVHGQYQRVFDPDKAPIVWMSYGAQGIPGLPGMDYYHFYGKDTIIHGSKHKRDTVINGESYLIAYGSNSPITYFQEDTVNGRIIEYGFDPSGNIQYQETIMDMSLDIGDTLSYPLNPDIVVDSIYYISGRKVIRCKYFDDYISLPNNQYYQSPFTFIEGIGNTKSIGFLHPHFYTFVLICVKNRDSIVYMAPFTDTCWLQGLHTQQWEEAQPSVFSIYPNPVTDVFSVSATFPLETYSVWKLTDAMGKEIRTGILANDEESIDIRALPSGVYFFRVQYKQEVYSHKVVKQ
ncbi:MAG: T9SS type A sorting domain-containing protein [Cryomorphaceae bacterium]|nr:T9SS type A sorting domain-containing protein [Cryomorphaceae bacterium]